MQPAISSRAAKALGAALAIWGASIGLTVTAGQPSQGSPPPAAVEKAAAVLERHGERLRALPAVVGTGVGASRKDRTQAAILVYVSRALTPAEQARFPAQLEGIAVEVVESGPFRALPQRELKFSRLRVEALRPPSAREARIIRSQAQWRDLLDAIGAESAAPAPDFSRVTVVALFAGERPTGGYHVEVDRVVEDSSNPRKAVVHYRVVPPARGALVTQALTYPYLVIAIEGKLDEIVFDPPVASPQAQ